MSPQQNIIYVTRDIERAMGIVPSDDHIIVANRTPYAESMKKQYGQNVYLIDPDTSGILDTAELFGRETVRQLINRNKADILVFKNTSRIENICKSNDWKLLNPSAELAEKIENKITQVEWLGELATEYLPPFTVGPTKDMKWAGVPSVIQWAHGHTGDGTIPVNSAAELSAIQKQFPERPARITAFEIGRIEKITQDVGKKMQESGWRGLFGIDVMRDDERGAIYLIEINARQPASTSFESLLQAEYRRQGIQGLTTFEAHLNSLRGETVTGSIIPINDGAQIIQRVTQTTKSIPEDTARSIELSGYKVIPYENTEYGSDLLRIQSMMNIMERHGKLNKRGKEIIDLISN
ncbi:MAG: hypothetical protein NTZ38_01100 [Candidatus Taylorbacteria bacterium]|nr:hypothetical protein [Candidatus Taylorbacteria bacterium]